MGRTPLKGIEKVIVNSKILLKPSDLNAVEIPFI